MGAISRAWAAADNPANAGGTIKRTWTSAEKMVLLSLIVALPPGERGAAFRAFREAYPERRELKGSRIVLSPARTRVARWLETLGAACDAG